MTVNTANQYIKDILKAYCDNIIPERAFEVKMPHVLHIDENEFKELSKSKTLFNFELSNIRFVIINIESNYYLIAAGDAELVSNNTDLVDSKITNTIFLGCVESLKLKVPPHVNAYQIIEQIYEPADGSDEGYSIDIICGFFEPLKVFAIPEEIARSKDLSLTIIGKMIVSNFQLKTLSFSQSTLDSFIDFFDNGFFDYNVINSFLSYCWRYSFLDAYRCLEPLFRHLVLPDLKSALGVNTSIDDLGELLDIHCGWRPQETGSMQKLFDENSGYISEGLISRFQSLSIGDDPNEKVGKSVYQLRNRIVHHQDKYSQIENKLSPHKWDLLIGCILDAIVELRKKFPYN